MAPTADEIQICPFLSCDKENIFLSLGSSSQITGTNFPSLYLVSEPFSCASHKFPFASTNKQATLLSANQLSVV